MALSVQLEGITSPVASALIAALDAELLQQYPEPGATHFRLDAEEVAEGRGAFFVAYDLGVPLGCGAVRRLDSTTAEIKRMYVVLGARGKGVGRAILETLELEARLLGVQRLVLETGTRQERALTLYHKAGFVEIPAFGEYVGSPASVCMAKTL